MASSNLPPRLWDNHLHCSFSADSKADPEAMILAAKEKGLAGITFTDHTDYDFPAIAGETPLVWEFDLDEYFTQLGRLRAKHSDEHFTVQIGIELGLQPHLGERYRELIESHAFDVVIGSTHVVDNMDIYYPAYYQGRSLEEAYTQYYETILANLAAFPHMDTCGHLDYAFRYGQDSGLGYDSYTPYAELVDAILEFLVKKDIALEVNTSPYRLGLGKPNPAPAIISRYRELGGELITLGSDAHEPKNVALGYEGLSELLISCGFKEFAVFTGRKAVMWPLK